MRIEDQEFHHWDERVSSIEITHEQVVNPNFVISTVDTLRHEYFISHWLKDKKLVILCGPPGSGKSMTLAAVLRANPQYEMVTLNFSSTADVDLISSCFDQYCKVSRRGNQGYVMAPVMQKKILVIFCDEINLPSPDNYGTMTIITFLRQVQEYGGFWRAEDKVLHHLFFFSDKWNPRSCQTESKLQRCAIFVVELFSKAFIEYFKLTVR